MKTKNQDQEQSKRPCVIVFCLVVFSFCGPFMLCAENIKPQIVQQAAQQHLETGLIKEAIGLIKKKYLFFDEVKPVEMLKGALNNLEHRFDEILVKESGEKAITLAVNNHQMDFFLREYDSLEDVIPDLTEILKFVRHHMEATTKVNEIEYAVLRGMMRVIDKYSVLLTGMSRENFKIRFTGKLSGVGMRIGNRNGKLTVISVNEESPAERAKLEAGDLITHIDGESTTNMAVSESLKRIRGKQGTSVALTITRPQTFEGGEFHIIRDIIRVESVIAHRLENNLGYMKITHFNGQTTQNLRNKIIQLEEKGHPLEGIIIDLRGNKGGSLKAAANLVNEFIEKGTIVSTEGKDGKRVEGLVYRVPAKKEQATLKSLALAIVIDKRSASAAEIVAGALNYADRALLVGAPTFGKGTVQKSYKLSDDAILKLTVARFLILGKYGIPEKGILPDILIRPITFNKDQIKISMPQKDKTESENRHIHASFISIDSVNISPVEENKEEEISVPFKEERITKRLQTMKQDFAVEVAKICLSEFPSLSKDEMLKKARLRLESIHKKKSHEIINQFSLFGIDWNITELDGCTSEGGKGIATIKTGEVNASNPLKPLQKAIVTLGLQNKGKSPLFRFYATVDSRLSPFWGKQWLFGRIDPGAYISKTIEIEAPLNIATRTDMLKIKFHEAFDRTPEQLSIPFWVKGVDQPEFSLSYKINDNGEKGSAGNGDGAVDGGETISLSIALTNHTPNDSGELVIWLNNPLNPKVELLSGRQELKVLRKGETQNIQLPFHVKEGYEDEVLTLTLNIRDQTYNTRLKKELAFQIGERVIEKCLDPPKVALHELPTYTGSAQIPLKGDLSDNEELKIFMVFINQNKIFLKLFSEKKTGFSFNVPLSLDEGENDILLIVKDNTGLETVKNLWIWYDKNLNIKEAEKN